MRVNSSFFLLACFVESPRPAFAHLDLLYSCLPLPQSTMLISDEIADAAVSLTSHLLRGEHHAQALIEAGSEQALVTISRLARLPGTKKVASSILKRIGELTDDTEGAQVRHEFFADSLMLELGELGVEMMGGEVEEGRDSEVEKSADETVLLPADEVEDRLRAQSELLRKANEELRRRTSSATSRAASRGGGEKRVEMSKVKGAVVGEEEEVAAAAAAAAVVTEEAQGNKGGKSKSPVAMDGEKLESSRENEERPNLSKQDNEQHSKPVQENKEKPKSAVAALKAKLEGKIVAENKAQLKSKQESDTRPKSAVAALKAKLEGKLEVAGAAKAKGNSRKPATPAKPKAKAEGKGEPAASTPPPPQPAGAPNSKQSKVAALKAKLGGKIGGFGLGGLSSSSSSATAASRKRPGSVSALAAKLEGRFAAVPGGGAGGQGEGPGHRRGHSYSAPPLPSWRRPTNSNLVKKRRGEKIAKLKAKMKLSG